MPDSYSAEVTGSAADGYVVTNTEGPTEVPVSKVWKNSAGDTLPWPGDDVVVTVTLVADGTETDKTVELTKTSPSGSFTNLPITNTSGKEIEYTIAETNVSGLPEGYSAEVTGSAEDGFTVTNTEDSTELPVKKIWKNPDLEDLPWPEGAEVTVALVIDDVVSDTTCVLKADQDSYTFKDLPITNPETGKPYEYSVTEQSVSGVSDDYSMVVDGSAEDGYVVTNTRKTGDLTVSKTVDSVIASDSNIEFSFTVTLDDKTIGGAEGKTYGDMTFTNGVATFTLKNGEEKTAEDLPVGITYTVEETANNGFTTTWTGETGKITVDGCTAEFTNTRIYTSASVMKVWIDDDDRDCLRPGQLTVYLLANGEKPAVDSVVLKDENNWFARIDNLPKCDDAGDEIEYTWEESDAGKAAGYELTNTRTTGTLTTLTNTRPPKKTEISVKKIWVDDGTHPNEVKVMLFANGLAAEDKEVTLSAKNNWTYTWKDLCLNENVNGAATKIQYTVEETEIPDGYVAKVSGNASTGFVITNTKDTGKLIIEKTFDIEKPDEPDKKDTVTEIEVVKIWDDNDDKDGNRPKSITVHLLAGGKEVREAQLSAATDWKWKFEKLPKYANGKPIHYTVTEDPVEWYKAEINEFTIVNKYQPEVTSVTVRKVWDDNNNELKLRPKQIVMHLSNGMKVVLNEENGWTATITDLPTRINGQPAVYTWTEGGALGYEMESKTTNGTVTTFTNRLWKRPDEPGPGKKPKTPGDTVEIDEYETPLGVEIIINHVGDCFD